MFYQRHPNQRRGRNQGAWMEQPSFITSSTIWTPFSTKKREDGSTRLIGQTSCGRSLKTPRPRTTEVPEGSLYKDRKEVRQELQRLQKYTDAHPKSAGVTLSHQMFALVPVVWNNDIHFLWTLKTVHRFESQLVFDRGCLLWATTWVCVQPCIHFSPSDSLQRFPESSELLMVAQVAADLNT